MCCIGRLRTESKADAVEPRAGRAARAEKSGVVMAVELAEVQRVAAWLVASQVAAEWEEVCLGW